MADWKQWGEQLKAYRLRAGYASQTELADALSHLELTSGENLILSTSQLSRWENGQRCPTRRAQHLDLIEGLARLGGIATPAEADAWLQAGQQGLLSADERWRLFGEALPPPPPTPDAALLHDHLPAQTTPFVGREEEMSVILDLLVASKRRLLTITGAGGMGKTRLSIAAAAQAAPYFADGVCFVPLADVETPEAILTAIATQLDVLDAGAADIDQRLHNFLRTKQLLLILDNFEHLMAHTPDAAVDPVESLSTLLQKSTRLTLLVTSQERLNLVEEWIYPLEGLAYPPEDHPDTGSAYAAVEFFAQCASKSRPDFDPILERPHIISICRLVEGMPLGIELDASWVRAFSCAEIAAELARDLDFLTTPLRNLPSRHRSLRALFNRSWALLSSQEQMILGRLSVFRSGFDRKSAEEIAGATPLVLTDLVDRSLIRRQPSGRYDMHGLLYQFVAEQFAQQPQARSETQARHAAFYADRVARAGWELEPEDPKAAAALHDESANVRYATALVLTQQGHSYLALKQINSASRSFAEALRIAREEGIDRVAVDALRGVAELVAQAGNSEQAVLLLRLVHAHPASEHETRKRAKARLLELSQPEAAASVQARHSNPLFDLEEAISLAEELVL